MYSLLALLPIFPQPRCMHIFSMTLRILYLATLGSSWQGDPRESSVRETPRFNGKLYKNMSYFSSRAAKAARLVMTTIEKNYWNESKRKILQMFMVYWKNENTWVILLSQKHEGVSFTPPAEILGCLCLRKVKVQSYIVCSFTIGRWRIAWSVWHLAGSCGSCMEGVRTVWCFVVTHGSPASAWCILEELKCTFRLLNIRLLNRRIMCLALISLKKSVTEVFRLMFKCEICNDPIFLP